MRRSDAASHADWIRAVVDRHEGPLMRSAARITGDLERARDVVQETFLRLCRERPEAVEDHLAEWLFTVCRNRALDVRRKEKRMHPMPSSVAPRPGGEPGPAEVLERRESVDRLLGALGRLPQRQQEILRLRFHGGLGYAEIGRVLGLTATNVGYLIHTGLKTIKGQLAAERP